MPRAQYLYGEKMQKINLCHVLRKLNLHKNSDRL